MYPIGRRCPRSPTSRAHSGSHKGKGRAKSDNNITIAIFTLSTMDLFFSVCQLHVLRDESAVAHKFTFPIRREWDCCQLSRSLFSKGPNGGPRTLHRDSIRAVDSSIWRCSIFKLDRSKGNCTIMYLNICRVSILAVCFLFLANGSPIENAEYHLKEPHPLAPATFIHPGVFVNKA